MDMAKNDVDERLVRWNEIFDELLIDAGNLSRDLLSGINYVGASGVLVIALGFVVLYYNLRTASLEDPLFWAMLALTSGSNFVLGVHNIMKYFQLKRKYSRLDDMQMRMKG